MLGKRWAITGPEQGELLEFSVPTSLDFGEVLLDISHSLISPGTEISMYSGHAGGEPIFPGYTAVGTVAGAAEGIDPELHGRQVFIFPALRDSIHCHATHKVVARDAILIPVPEGLDGATACFARMINVALTPFSHVEPRSTGTALIVGLGLVGNIAAQIARLRGYRVIGVDPDLRRRERAQQVGIEQLIDPGQCDLVAAVREQTGGRGAMLTINATGVAATFMTAIEATADGGELSTLGGARRDAGHDLQRFLHHIQFRHVTVRGGWEMTLPRRAAAANRTPSSEENLALAMSWLQSGTIDLKPIWTHTIAPAALPEAFAALRRADPDYLGVVVDWSQLDV